MRSEKIVVAHRIIPPESVEYFDLISNLDLGFEMFLFNFAGFLTVLFFGVFLINLLEFPNQTEKCKKMRLFSRIILLTENILMGNSILSSFGLFLIFCQLFIWHCQLFVTNNIKTNKVVIDTSDIIKDKQDLFSSKRVNCFMDEETETNMALTAPKGSILSKLYDEKTILSERMVKEKSILKNDRCLFKRDSSIVSLLNSYLYLTGSETAFYFLEIAFSQFGSLGKIWILDQDIYEFNIVFYYNLRNPSNDLLIKK